MKAKRKDKMLFQEKFPNSDILLETDASTDVENVYSTGSIFVTINEFIFIYSKKNFIYKIPWKDVLSLDKKIGFISNKCILMYEKDKKITLSFTSSDAVYSIDILYKSICLNVQNKKELIENIISLREENEKLLRENTELRKINNKYKSLYKTPLKELYESSKDEKHTLDLTYTKARKLTDTFVVIDFETTGLKYNEHEIIQYGIIEYKNGKIINEYSEYFKPNKQVSKRIEQKTGITNEFLQDKPALGKRHLEELHSLIKGKTLVAHNAPFDMKFLLNQFYLHDIQHEKFRVIDTLTYSRRLIKETPNHKLQTLKEYFNLDDGSSHNAINDCRATGNLLLLLLTRE
ncbi:exonuclease domain-containing protein [Mammaliicoccus sciuri]|uniref:exonuclease domain-containing protein n=1 Tax=Mammaliicoccus sciuri TaxID=1296 RepID=UPI0021CE6483|nr:exonuclease domain-containing protein [Mammaliicoccus sciuri]UXV31921.1 3'-5' exoribonuclease [Mammaliicoccus sciuri]